MYEATKNLNKNVVRSVPLSKKTTGEYVDNNLRSMCSPVFISLRRKSSITRMYEATKNLNQKVIRGMLLRFYSDAVRKNEK